MKIQIYQICYSQETLKNIPEGFLTLDNLSNERPDWREYWPIRNYLLSNRLSDNVLYGFFSPKFHDKTGLNLVKINRFIADNYKNQDTVSFSPFWDLSCIFQNVFEQGDFFHPGLADVCQKFADVHLSKFNLKESITHSQNTIFCNYFLATKKFWYEWLSIGELLFETSEKKQSDLARLLNNTTTYGPQQLPMKIFVQERLATISLLLNSKFRNLAYNPFHIGASSTPFNNFYNEAIVSDALKRAYAYDYCPVYLNELALYW